MLPHCLSRPSILSGSPNSLLVPNYTLRWRGEMHCEGLCKATHATQHSTCDTTQRNTRNATQHNTAHVIQRNATHVTQRNTTQAGLLDPDSNSPSPNNVFNIQCEIILVKKTALRLHASKVLCTCDIHWG